MIAYIKGEIESIEEGSVVIDNGGIGYRIFMPASALQSLTRGEERKIYTFFSVREDAMQLYGFLTEGDLAMFRMLIGVSGIGPKGAMGVLGAMNADEIRFAVLSEDAAAIARAPGIGRKTAQKVILELKDKMSIDDITGAQTQAVNAENPAAGPSSELRSEAVLALKALGYSGTEAWKAVNKAAAQTEKTDVESLIKAALRQMV